MSLLSSPAQLWNIIFGDKGSLYNKPVDSLYVIENIGKRYHNSIDMISLIDGHLFPLLGDAVEYFKWGKIKYVQHMNDNLCPNELCKFCNG